MRRAELLYLDLTCQAAWPAGTVNFVAFFENTIFGESVIQEALLVDYAGVPACMSPRPASPLASIDNDALDAPQFDQRLCFDLYHSATPSAAGDVDKTFASLDTPAIGPGNLFIMFDGVKHGLPPMCFRTSLAVTRHRL